MELKAIFNVCLQLHQANENSGVFLDCQVTDNHTVVRVVKERNIYLPVSENWPILYKEMLKLSAVEIHLNNMEVKKKVVWASLSEKKTQQHHEKTYRRPTIRGAGSVTTRSWSTSFVKICKRSISTASLVPLNIKVIIV